MMPEKTIFFTKENGQKIAAKLFYPKTGEGPYPTVIFAHGFNGNYRELEHYGPVYADAGICCMLFDFCGGGTASFSDGAMQDMTVRTEIEDLKAVVRCVQELPSTDKTQLFLQGESMGGFVAALVAAELLDAVRGLILWYPAFVLPEEAAQRYAAGMREFMGIPLGAVFDETAMDIPVYALIGAYKGPVLLIHGDRDPVVPLSASEKALRIYENARLLVVPGAGHGFGGDYIPNAGMASVEFVLQNPERL